MFEWRFPQDAVPKLRGLRVSTSSARAPTAQRQANADFIAIAIVNHGSGTEKKLPKLRVTVWCGRRRAYALPFAPCFSQVKMCISRSTDGGESQIYMISFSLAHPLLSLSYMHFSHNVNCKNEASLSFFPTSLSTSSLLARLLNLEFFQTKTRRSSERTPSHSPNLTSF